MTPKYYNFLWLAWQYISGNAFIALNCPFYAVWLWEASYKSKFTFMVWQTYSICPKCAHDFVGHFCSTLSLFCWVDLKKLTLFFWITSGTLAVVYVVGMAKGGLFINQDNRFAFRSNNTLITIKLTWQYYLTLRVHTRAVLLSGDGYKE